MPQDGSGLTLGTVLTPDKRETKLADGPTDSFLVCISQDLQTPAGHNHSEWPWTVELGADSIMEVGTKDIALASAGGLEWIQLRKTSLKKKLSMWSGGQRNQNPYGWSRTQRTKGFPRLPLTLPASIAWWPAERAGAFPQRELAGAEEATAQLQPRANKGSRSQGAPGRGAQQSCQPPPCCLSKLQATFDVADSNPEPYMEWNSRKSGSNN